MRGTRGDYEAPTREEVEALVEKYLDAPFRASKRGGFADMPEGDKKELDTLIEALVKFRYEPDSDGDRPVKWNLCDWTREQPHSFGFLPQDKDDGSNFGAVYGVAMMNLSMAMEDVRRLEERRRWDYDMVKKPGAEE